MHGMSAHGTSVERTVRSVVCRQLRIRPDSLTHDVDLRDLGVDDEDALQVIVEVERELDVRFPDDFLDGVRTYGDLASAVRIAVGE